LSFVYAGDPAVRHSCRSGESHRVKWRPPFLHLPQTITTGCPILVTARRSKDTGWEAPISTRRPWISAQEPSPGNVPIAVAIRQARSSRNLTGMISQSKPTYRYQSKTDEFFHDLALNRRVRRNESSEAFLRLSSCQRASDAHPQWCKAGRSQNHPPPGDLSEEGSGYWMQSGNRFQSLVISQRHRRINVHRAPSGNVAGQQCRREEEDDGSSIGDWVGRGNVKEEATQQPHQRQ
jgi:hypothetical protein